MMKRLGDAAEGGAVDVKVEDDGGEAAAHGEEDPPEGGEDVGLF